MTNEERKALVAALIGRSTAYDDLHCTAANQIEADGKRIAELEAALRDVIECDPGAYEATIARAALGDKTDD